ncbi:SDR family NAD(P)-dependent oxidoreductase [Methyloceanibacter caenitepidi]|uniref:Oxidoreductase, short-chain dehydrogenase/reductase family n=1 Tax=Methyloceanibacter caenitepidi TaxID=1384459 RepID=A0A0A8JZ71_9HYPH|nr:SDR family NAD(P)-dependent oxidoreductase [Methyloceanibacter caenitepidi]BAQ15637.1 oxidoreductase, short-chain dehydrogenase/reductase family [Methyloceanibacter caenitepidi]
MTGTPALPWRTAWIVGASSGLGAALAKLLDGRVGTVAISARSADSLSAMQAESKTLVAYPLDVTDADAVARCYRDIEKKAGGVDLVVLSAGTWDVVEPPEIDPAVFKKSMDVNFMGVVNVLAQAVPGMMRREAGQIAIISSVAGYRGLPKAAAYGPTKAALINLAESLHPELAAKGVTLSIVNPGFVDTPMTAVNDFPMPFLMPVDDAAQRLLQGLERKAYEITFPRRFTWAMKALRLLPNAVYFWIVRTFVLRP